MNPNPTRHQFERMERYQDHIRDHLALKRQIEREQRSAILTILAFIVLLVILATLVMYASRSIEQRRPKAALVVSL
jgi:hypothetical protein